MADEEKKGKSKDVELLAEACKAYGIDKKYVMSSNFYEDTGTVVILTVGGSKVSFQSGQKVKPLDSISVTGVNPSPKRKPIAGKAAE